MLKKEKKEVTEGSPLRSGRRLLGRETPAVGSQRLVHNPKEGIVTSLAPARPFFGPGGETTRDQTEGGPSVTCFLWRKQKTK